MDLSGIPVIDTHCHPFYPEQGAVDRQLLRDATSVSLRGKSSPLNESMMLSRMVLKELARVLDCRPDWEHVMTARNERAAEDPAGYNALLFNDANIRGLLIDCGFPPDREISLTEFAAALPCGVVEGYRVERFSKGDSFHDSGFTSLASYLDAFLKNLDDEASRPTTHFFKTIIAYRTGLAINKVDEREATAAWNAHQQFGDEHEKTIRDFLFWHTALKTREHGLALQVHTGHTSHVNVWPNVNPILMTPILNDPELQDVSIVLVHGGYPYCTEAGYMTSVYPNLSLDLSLMIPWSSIGIASRIRQTLEAAPTAKVMYGSDGIWVPELYWIGAINTRKALKEVLEGFVEDRMLEGDEADEIAHDILWRNAVRIYGLDGWNVA